MAQKVQVFLVCDLHDGEDVAGVETVIFGLDGVSYEIDACSDHVAQLRDAFAPYVGQARKAGRVAAPGRRKATASAADPDRITAIRAWGRKNGHKVSERGRLSSTLVAAYDAAN